ncbi:hypothetical protein M378DRAFT_11244 [Amanita muscaria Koide BX008]|uniref:Gag protein n=1 Tax=Amanita muscaria (strain Koide BX008) TaxID=946122 RepID=A0A0C2SNV9_AMAMK|nr:hypothetical protein M378DRAFT_11244 [Amanita muscaria Koide BX008]
MSSNKDIGSTVPMFDGSNWIQWEPLMKAYLKYSSVWQYVDGTATILEDPLLHILSDEPDVREELQPLVANANADPPITAAMVQQRNQYINERNQEVVAYNTWVVADREARIKNRAIIRTYDDDVQDYEDGLHKAIAMIMMKVTPSLHHMVVELKPSDTWKSFQTQFGTVGAAGIYLDWMKLKDFTMSPKGDPTVQITKLRQLIDKLAPNVQIPDTLQACILLGSLPADWRSSFQTLLITVEPKDLTIAKIQPKILEEYRRKQATGEAPLPQASNVNAARHNTFGQNPTAPAFRGRGRGGSRGGQRGRGRGGHPYNRPAQQQQQQPQQQQQQPQQTSGNFGQKKDGTPRKGPNTQQLAPGTYGPNYVRNVQRKATKKAFKALNAAATYTEGEEPLASTTQIQEYANVLVDVPMAEAGPGPTTLLNRIASAPPVPSAYVQKEQPTRVPGSRRDQMDLDEYRRFTARISPGEGLAYDEEMNCNWDREGIYGDYQNEDAVSLGDDMEGYE